MLGSVRICKPPPIDVLFWAPLVSAKNAAPTTVTTIATYERRPQPTYDRLMTSCDDDRPTPTENPNTHTCADMLPTASENAAPGCRVRSGPFFNRGSKLKIKISHVTWYADFHKRHMRFLTSVPNFRESGWPPLTRPSGAPDHFAIRFRSLLGWSDAVVTALAISMKLSNIDPG